MQDQKKYELRTLKYEKEAQKETELQEFANEKLDPIVKVLKDTGVGGYIEPDEFKSMVLEFNIKEHEYPKFAKTVTYVRQRFVYKKTRYESFKIAFPERFASSDNRSTIETKALRVEEYRYYSMIVGLLSTNMYISYVINRMKVLDETLDKIFDPEVSDKNKAEFIKIFLQETRKPDNVKGMELNVNIQQNNVSISKVEQTMKDVANKLENLDAEKFMEVLDGN